MGIYARGFEFFGQFPEGEKILVQIFKNSGLKVDLSIWSPLYNPDTGKVLKTYGTEDFSYLLTHPIGPDHRLGRYRPVELMRMEFEGRKLIYLTTSPSPKEADVMDLVAAALQDIGGVETKD